MRKLLPLLAVCLSAAFSASSQCTTANVNWDALDYFPTTGYTGFSLTSTMSPKQTFAFGKNKLTIFYSGCTSSGENNNHTATSLPSSIPFGGEDVQFNNNGTITISFTAPVTNLQFSIFDIDGGQSVVFSATNNGVATPLTLTASSTTTDLTISGSTVSNTKNTKSDVLEASVNVSVPGPVTSVTMVSTGVGVTGGADVFYWLSDITACVTGSFPANYYEISRPYTGMPGYVLVAANKGVYMLNPANGRAKLIFTDGATSGTINSLAYDPYNKVIYYTWSLTNNGSANASERTLRKYDLKANNPTPSTALTDVNSISLPTLSQGVESGAAAFYDGALYLGIEGGADGGNGDVGGGGGGGPKASSGERESIIWRVDFDDNGNPATATQIWATSGQDHDWSDFAIVDGILYDSNGESTKETYYHYNLQTGVNTPKNDIGVTPKQTAVGWDNKIYWVSNQIGEYDLNGGVGVKQTIVGSPTAIPGWGSSTSPSFGDAAEAFRPKADFGDAPNSYDRYDIDTLSPAVHEISSNLRLGATSDDEWNKPAITSADASEDGSDEDGLAYTRILVNGANYQIDVRVLNNTGANATLCAWVDNNNNGVFETSEGVTASVPSSSSAQTVQLMWTPGAILPDNSYTYLRVRLTSATNNMTTSSPIGYFPDGEVEDYRIIVSSTTLAVKLSDFSARKTAEEKVSLTWNVTDEEAGTKYEIERGSDGQVWSVIHSRSAQTKSAKAAYQSVDAAPSSGDNYYRLKIIKIDGSVVYSTIKKVVFEKPVTIQVTPNPASSSARLSVQSAQRASAHIRIVDMNGRVLYERDVVVEEGLNGYALPVQQLPAGMYQAEVWIDSKRYCQQLVVRK
jgi:hypothetical protein